ncbi:hypothetical protein AGABI2DRAFT_136443, partial [Agaricus bisporus var. bisporus H97]|uniref:hypothetical protein n=1 Tax=Agaricus bisporus var. bisporus (strain H97 / ATCC MYA-4626 / FGSC 10389) TaxID=936046 RepID=UPI00029F52CF
MKICTLTATLAVLFATVIAVPKPVEDTPIPCPTDWPKHAGIGLVCEPQTTQPIPTPSTSSTVTT